MADPIYYVQPEEIGDFYPDSTPEKLIEICSNITEEINEYANTSFTPVGFSEKLDSKPDLIPTMGPLISVQSLKDFGLVLTEDVGFHVYPDYIHINAASNKRKSVEITYTYGHVKIPEMVKRVAKELAQYYAEDPTVSALFISQKADDFSYELDEEGQISILKKLDSSGYVRPKQTGDKFGKKVLRVGVI